MPKKCSKTEKNEPVPAGSKQRAIGFFIYPITFFVVAGFYTFFTPWHSIPLLEDASKVYQDVGVNSTLATTLNGTYLGRYCPQFHQHLYLGIPYAKPPVGSLRFRSPQSLTERWDGERDASEFKSFCYGHGRFSDGYPLSEDCLNLNIIRPASIPYDQKLPVAVWVHGGGFRSGGSWHRETNFSYLVQHSKTISKPIIGVAIDYRLTAWGFLESEELRRDGDINVALKDQRMALRWVQENIEAFGGDPKQVTLWGHSAGAASVGFHLLAYGGRDDGLFHRAIIQSSGPIPYGRVDGHENNLQVYQSFLKQANCDTAADGLKCLQQIPADSLDGIISQLSGSWFPVVDDDFIIGYPSQSMKEGKFIPVPLLAGANTDEGTTSVGGNANQFNSFLTQTSSLDAKVVEQFAHFYPDDPCFGPPYNMLCDEFKNEYQGRMGTQWRRTAAYLGDSTFTGPRRFTCQTWADAGVTAYCYRFNSWRRTNPPLMGASHAEELEFIFGSIVENASEGKARFDLSKEMARAWASFIYDGDPNYQSGVQFIRWQPYDSRNPQNWVFEENTTSHLEPDSFRAEGIQLIAEHFGDYHR